MAGRQLYLEDLRRRGGSWLKMKRLQAGKTQLEVAKAIGVAYYTFVSSIEAGEGRVPPDAYDAWARALDIPTREFVANVLRFYDPHTFASLGLQDEYNYEEPPEPTGGRSLRGRTDPAGRTRKPKKVRSE